MQFPIRQFWYQLLLDLGQVISVRPGSNFQGNQNVKIVKCKYSETSLQWTPSGPQNSVGYKDKKWTRMLFLWFLLIFTVKEKWSSMYNRNLHDCIHISIPVPLRFGHPCKRKTSQPQRWMRTGIFYKFTIPTFSWKWKGH